MANINVFYPEYAKVLHEELKTNDEFAELFKTNHRARQAIAQAKMSNFMVPLWVVQQAYDKVRTSNLPSTVKDKLEPFQYCSNFWQVAYLDIGLSGKSTVDWLKEIKMSTSCLRMMMHGAIGVKRKVDFLNLAISRTNSKIADEWYRKEKDKTVQNMDMIKFNISAICNKNNISVRDAAILLGMTSEEFINKMDNLEYTDINLDSKFKTLVNNCEHYKDFYLRSVPKELVEDLKVVSTPSLFKLYKETEIAELNPYKKFNDSKTMFRLIMMELYGSVKKGFSELGITNHEWKDIAFKILASKRRLKNLIAICDVPEYKEFLEVKLDHSIHEQEIRDLRTKFLNEDPAYLEWVIQHVGYASIYTALKEGASIGYRKTQDAYTLLKILLPNDPRIEIFNVDTWENFEKLKEKFI